MEKTLDNSRGDFATQHLPGFVVCPSPRCCHRLESTAPTFCGELAAWKREGWHWFDDLYFCERHRAPADQPITRELIIRRVRISADILLAGVSMRGPVCQGEALARVQAAIGALGGIVDVHHVLSTVGHYRPAPMASGAIRTQDDRM